MELLIAFLIGLVPVVIILVVRSAKKTNEAWEEAGRILGLRYKTGALLKGRRMRGEVDGVAVVVETYTKSSGKSSQTYTRYRAYHPRPLAQDLKLTQQGFFAGIGKMLGVTDIETGDKNFDDLVLVKSSSAVFAREYLTPSRRVLVRRFLEGYRGGTVDAQRVTWSKKGLVRHSGLLVSTTRKLVAFVRALDADREDGELLDEATVERVVVVPPAPPTHEGIEISEDRTAPAVLFPIPGGDGPKSAEDGEFAPVDEPVPAVEPPPLPTVEIVPDPAPVPAPEESESLPPEEPAPDEIDETDADDLDIAAVCSVLFGEGVSSIQGGKVFEEHFAGRRVRWSGALRSADAFTYDFVFGGEAGTKAVFEVHLLEADTYRETWALAVVHLPAGVHDELRERKGDTLTFEGVLKKVEDFTKSVFVAEGALVQGAASGRAPDR